MIFDLRPLQGIGPIDFGMPRDEVRRILNCPHEAFMKTPESVQPTDDFRSLNIHVYYDKDLRCQGVELWPGADLRCDGHKVLRRPWDEVRIWLVTLAPGLDIKESLVKAPQVGLTLYVPDMDDEPEARIESVYAFKTWE